MKAEWLPILSAAIAVLSAAIAVLALLISAIHAKRNTRAISDANHIQVISDAFKEVRSAEFRRNFDIIFSCPRRGEELEEGFRSLTAQLRESAYVVCYFFEHIGLLTDRKLIDKKIFLTVMSSIMQRAWHALEPAIEAERAFRKRTYPAYISPTFLPHYERLVELANSPAGPTGRRRRRPPRAADRAGKPPTRTP